MNKKCYSTNTKYSLVLDSFIPPKSTEHVVFHFIPEFNQAIKKFKEKG